MTQIRATRHVDCPFSATLEFVAHAAERRSGFYVTPSRAVGERVRFGAANAPDVTDTARKHDALLIAWRPQNRAMFPDFRGVLTVRPKRRGALLRLLGRYDPPYGIAGKVFDIVVGRAIAHHTLRHLLDEFASEIEAEYREERHHYSAASTM